MGLSLIDFSYDGVTDEFDLNFAMGYADRDDVACYKNVVELPVDISFEWLTDSRVRIDTTDLEVGDVIRFTRTVSKLTLPVDLTQPENLTREAVTLAVTHSMHAMHELLDGRFGDVVEVGDAVFTLVEAAVTTALSNFIFSSQLKQDLVLRVALDAAVTATYTSGGLSAFASGVDIYVEENPTSPIEVLVMNDGVVKYSFNVSETGVISGESTQDLTLIAGPVTVEVSGGNYSAGGQVAIVIPTYFETILDFDAQVSDYVALLEEARTT